MIFNTLSYLIFDSDILECRLNIQLFQIIANVRFQLIDFVKYFLGTFLKKNKHILNGKESTIFRRRHMCTTNVDSNKRRHRTNVVLKKSYFVSEIKSNKQWLEKNVGSDERRFKQTLTRTNVDCTNVDSNKCRLKQTSILANVDSSKCWF